MTKIKSAAGFFGAGLLGLMLSGCTVRLMDFTVLSTKNVSIPGARGPQVEGEDIAKIIVIIPTGQPNIKTAIDRAIESGGGDLLVDGGISMKSWYIPYVYGEQGFIAEGTAVNTKAAAPAVSRKVARTSAKKAPAAPAEPDSDPNLGPPTPPASVSAPAPAPAPTPAETPTAFMQAAPAPAAAPPPQPPAAPAQAAVPPPAPAEASEAAAQGARPAAISLSEAKAELLP